MDKKKKKITEPKMPPEPGKGLEEWEREIVIEGDQFDEADIEALETAPAEEHDVVQFFEKPIVANQDQIPEGMETAIREDDVFEVGGQDEETGED
ncbi:MAG TPA: hypothetical protein VFQ60_03025 [Patescibacteria group bacterium]|nr:hypothetical protein [Patescibacteria group bacterium]